MEFIDTAAHSIGRGFDLRMDNDGKGYNKGYYCYWRGALLIVCADADEKLSVVYVVSSPLMAQTSNNDNYMVGPGSHEFICETVLLAMKEKKGIQNSLNLPKLNSPLHHQNPHHQV